MSEILPAGEAIRAYRAREGMSLEDLADRIAGEGCERPSTAKLSRIETGIQPVAPDVLPAISKLTGIPKRELRPDLAEVMREAAE